MARPTFSSIDDYIESFPAETQKVLKKIRNIARKILPKAEETISYGIPTFKLNGKYVIYFAGFKNHVSLYPITSGTEVFNKAIEPYVKGKGTVQFQLKDAIPYDLIEKIVSAGLEAHIARTKAKNS